MRRRVTAVVAGLGLLAGAACASGTPGPTASAPATTSTVGPATAAPVTSTTVSDAGTVPATAPATVPTTAGGARNPATTRPPAAAAQAGTAAAPCPAPPARALPRDDRSRYTVTAAVDPAAGTVTGTVSVRFTPDLATDRIVLRLWPDSPNMAAAGAHLDPGPVTVDGAAVESTRTDATTLSVPVPVAAGHTVTVALPWSLTLARGVGERDAKAGDAVRLGSFFPILAWEPGHGWAIDAATRVHGETAMTPTADYELTVTAPAGYDVVATGTEDRPGHWSAPLVGDLAVAVGHFRTATAVAHAPQPVQVTVVADRGVQDDPGPYAAKIATVLEQYGRRFGPYPWASYTLAITPGLVGGIEYPMLVHTGPGAIGRSTSHEVGHQWFYGLVENDQGRDPWLDEGLASWAEAGYEGTLASFRARAIPAAARGRLDRPTTFWDAISADYYAGVYVQGVQALAALGPPARVDCALALYVAANAYRVARPADLVAALTAVFPDAAAVLARYSR